MMPPNIQPDNEDAIRLDVVQALAGLNCDANLELVQRTRRVVRNTAIGLGEQRMRQRRNVGFAILALLALPVLLAPAIWNGVEDLLGGEHFADLPIQIAFLLLMLFPTMIAALIAGWRGHNVHGRRGF